MNIKMENEADNVITNNAIKIQTKFRNFLYWKIMKKILKGLLLNLYANEEYIYMFIRLKRKFVKIPEAKKESIIETNKEKKDIEQTLKVNIKKRNVLKEKNELDLQTLDLVRPYYEKWKRREVIEFENTLIYQLRGKKKVNLKITKEEKNEQKTSEVAINKNKESVNQVKNDEKLEGKINENLNEENSRENEEKSESTFNCRLRGKRIKLKTENEDDNIEIKNEDNSNQDNKEINQKNDPGLKVCIKKRNAYSLKEKSEQDLQNLALVKPYYEKWKRVDNEFENTFIYQLRGKKTIKLEIENNEEKNKEEKNEEKNKEEKAGAENSDFNIKLRAKRIALKIEEKTTKSEAKSDEKILEEKNIESKNEEVKEEESKINKKGEDLNVCIRRRNMSSKKNVVENLDTETLNLIRPYYEEWKNGEINKNTFIYQLRMKKKNKTEENVNKENTSQENKEELKKPANEDLLNVCIKKRNVSSLKKTIILDLETLDLIRPYYEKWKQEELKEFENTLIYQLRRKKRINLKITNEETNKESKNETKNEEKINIDQIKINDQLKKENTSQEVKEELKKAENDQLLSVNIKKRNRHIVNTNQLENLELVKPYYEKWKHYELKRFENTLIYQVKRRKKVDLKITNEKNNNQIKKEENKNIEQSSENGNIESNKIDNKNIQDPNLKVTIRKRNFSSKNVNNINEDEDLLLLILPYYLRWKDKQYVLLKQTMIYELREKRMLKGKLNQKETKNLNSDTIKADKTKSEKEKPSEDIKVTLKKKNIKSSTITSSTTCEYNSEKFGGSIKPYFDFWRGIYPPRIQFALDLRKKICKLGLNVKALKNSSNPKINDPKTLLNLALKNFN